MTQLLLLALALTLGLFASTQTFAYLMRLHANLGAALYRDGWIAAYGPWKIVQWAWWWGQLAPSTFALPAIIGLVTIAWTLRAGWQGTPKKSEAHWATEQELREVECRGDHGIILGWTGHLWWRKLVCYSGRLHVFFVGRTGGGKTNTLTSTLLQYRHSVLLMDPKKELYTRTAGYRATLGAVYLLSPTEEATACYNFWDRIDPASEDAFREVDLLSHYLLEKEEKGAESSAGAFFRGLGVQFLNGLSLYGLTTGLATCGEDFNDLITMTDWDGLCQSMQEHAHPLVQQAGKLGAQGKGEVHDSLRLTLIRALSIFSDPRVAAMTRTTTFPLTALREDQTPCTVYWHVPFRDQPRLKRLMRLFFHQVLDYCTQERFLLDSTQARRQPTHPLLWVAEEITSLGYFPQATGGLNYYRGYGIQMLLLTPSMQELVKEFGEYHNFLEETYIQCVFGLSHTKTARQFAESIGEHEVPTTRTTRHGGKTSTSIEHRKEALLDATGIRKLPRGTVLIFAGEHAVVAEQAPFYQHREWHRRSQLPVPHGVSPRTRP